MKKFSKDLAHYLPLVGILFAGFLGFMAFRYDQYFQAVIAVAMVVSYVAWGIVHHKIHDDLYLEVVLEYLAYAAIGLVVILSIILQE